VVYDIFILGLMIAGILSVAVFSYKIFHSRVYPIGVVRKIPASQAFVAETSAELSGLSTSRFEAEVMGLLYKYDDSSITEIAHHSGRDIDIGAQLPQLAAKRYTKQRRLSHQSGRVQRRFVVYWRDPEREESAEEIELRSKLEDFEGRIRRLEIESVQKLQEADEEKPQPPLVVN
jgi:hypothetical protein